MVQAVRHGCIASDASASWGGATNAWPIPTDVLSTPGRECTLCTGPAPLSCSTIGPSGGPGKRSVAEGRQEKRRPWSIL